MSVTTGTGLKTKKEKAPGKGSSKIRHPIFIVCHHKARQQLKIDLL